MLALPNRALVARVVAELLDRSGETSFDFFRSELVVNVVVLFRGRLDAGKNMEPHIGK